MNEDANSWAQLGEDIEGEELGDQSGFAVSLSSDGRTVATGAVYNDGDGEKLYSGHVRIYNFVEDDSSRSWKQVGQDIDGEATSDNSGISLSLSANEGR